jgi:phage shock protein B
MEDTALAVPIVAIVFYFIYKTAALFVGGPKESSRSKRNEGEAGPQQRELYDLALRLQNRVETLERLLDTTQPEWRGKP